MADHTGISWTDATWNPSTGCTHVSAGCQNCYAETMAHRLRTMGKWRYRNGFTYTEHPDVIVLPRTWKAPKLVFVNSMSDLFHQSATKQFVWSVFDTMMEVDRHVYQVLTKRPGKMASWVLEYCRDREIDRLPPHIWCGTSIENQRVDDRLAYLDRVPATVRFLSCEPLIGPLDLRLAWDKPSVDWVIVGGESGPDYRPMDLAWARSIRDQCIEDGVPFFFKQSAGRRPGLGTTLDGREWHEFPAIDHPALAGRVVGTIGREVLA